MAWLWLFSSAYLIHIAEEYWGGDGYCVHMAKTRGVDLPSGRFLTMTAIGLVLLITGILLAERLRFPQTMLVILGTVYLINGISHVITGIQRSSYNPGLISGIVVWMPLGCAALILLRGDMKGHKYLMAIAIGLSIQVIVSVLSRNGGKLFRGAERPQS